MPKRQSMNAQTPREQWEALLDRLNKAQQQLPDPSASNDRVIAAIVVSPPFLDEQLLEMTMENPGQYIDYLIDQSRLLMADASDGVKAAVSHFVDLCKQKGGPQWYKPSREQCIIAQRAFKTLDNVSEDPYLFRRSFWNQMVRSSMTEAELQLCDIQYIIADLVNMLYLDTQEAVPNGVVNLDRVGPELDRIVGHKCPGWMLREFEILTGAIATLEQMLGYGGEPQRKMRPRRPSIAAAIEPFKSNLHLPAQTNLTSMMLDVASSRPKNWQRKCNNEFDGYVFETVHGLARIEHITTNDALTTLLKLIGAEGLQYTAATLAHIGNVLRQKYNGILPENYNDLNPITLVASDILRSMHRKKCGHSYKREQQHVVRQFLKAANMIDYAYIKATQDGLDPVRVGPLINVLYYDIDPRLPLEDIDDPGDVISITVLPGVGAYSLMRKGIQWFHPKLLEYHPNNNRFAIHIGVYLGQLAVNRRYKDPPQNWVSIGAIEKGAGLTSLDSNSSRRLQRLREALQQLAADGVIPAKINSDGRYMPIYDNVNSASSLAAERNIQVMCAHREQMPNNYTPIR